MKKLQILLLLITVFGLAACNKEQEYNYTGLSKLTPFVVDANDVYATLTIGEQTVYISEQKMNQLLKSTAGITVLKEMADTIILRSIEFRNSNYVDALTEEEIINRFEEQIFPEGKENVTESEQQYRINAFTSNVMFSAYRLQLAKEKYYYDRLQKSTFSETDYVTIYNARYFQQHIGVFLPFSSIEEAKSTLEDWGIELVDSVWRWINTEIPLEDWEVVRVFIEMNNVIQGTSLEENVDYEVDNGITFLNDITDSPLLLNRTMLLQYHTQALNFFLSNEGYLQNSSDFYTKNITTFPNGKVALAMKLTTIPKSSLQEVRSEIKEILIDNHLNSEAIEEEMFRLRRQRSIQVYDIYLERIYSSQAALNKATYISVNIDSPTVVGVVNSQHILREDFNKLLQERYGPTMLAREAAFYEMLFDTEYNTIADYRNGIIKNHDKWMDIVRDVTNVIQTFTASAYVGMGLENYLLQEFGARTKEELRDRFVYEAAMTMFMDKVSSLRNSNGEDVLWAKYEQEMQAMHDEYFITNGHQITIYVRNQNGQPKPIEEWTTEEIQLATQFHEEIVEYLTTADGKIELNMVALFLAFLDTPFTNSEPTVFLDVIPLQMYKNSGLRLHYEELNNKTNSMFAPEYVATINTWLQQEIESTSRLFEDIIATELGYHVYLNISYKKPALPTFAQAKAYAISEAAHGLTLEQLISVRTYYLPVASKYQNLQYATRIIYERVLNRTISLQHDYFDVSDYRRAIEEGWLD